LGVVAAISVFSGYAAAGLTLRKSTIFMPTFN